MPRKVKVQDTLLSAVARKLGRAAGTLVNATQRLAHEAELRSESKEESAERLPVTEHRNQTAKKNKAKAAKRTAKSRTAPRVKTTETRKGARRKG